MVGVWDTWIDAGITCAHAAVGLVYQGQRECDSDRWGWK